MSAATVLTNARRRTKTGVQFIKKAIVSNEAKLRWKIFRSRINENISDIDSNKSIVFPNTTRLSLSPSLPVHDDDSRRNESSVSHSMAFSSSCSFFYGKISKTNERTNTVTYTHVLYTFVLFSWLSGIVMYCGENSRCCTSSDLRHAGEKESEKEKRGKKEQKEK